ncbi:MAG: glycosyltransferase family 4 protein [Rhodospirillales bacterium]|nr:glycosyltransferase family 4 protein [Rhodospirillales bacterium]
MSVTALSPARPGTPSSVWLLLDSRQPGGIESHVATLARALVARGVAAEVVFLADHGAHPLKAALDGAGIAHTTLAGTMASLFAALRQRRPAIVHTHGYKAGVLGRLMARLLGLPVVSSFHAGEPGFGRMRLYVATDYLTARFAHCIAVSDAIRERLPQGSALIENFVELPAAPAAAAGPRPETVAFVGRLSHEKGPDTFCSLAAAFPHLRFCIYGDGPMRRTLEAAHAHHVRFAGMVAGMAEHWQDVGLLCMPSRHEGLPMAALEAMAYGVPVAAFAVGALPRCIAHERTGWLVPPGDVPAMAAAIAAWQAMDDTAVRAAARAAVAAAFSPAIGVDKVLAVYARAIGASPA